MPRCGEEYCGVRISYFGAMRQSHECPIQEVPDWTRSIGPPEEKALVNLVLFLLLPRAVSGSRGVKR